MIISEKMKPVITILLVILVILAGLRIYQLNQQSKFGKNAYQLEMIETWTSYMITLQKHISSNVIFSNDKLSCDINFDIDREGEISNVKLVKSSNDKSFDEQMILAVKKSSPCKHLPEKYIGNGVTVNITLGKNIIGSQVIKEW